MCATPAQSQEANASRSIATHNTAGPCLCEDGVVNVRETSFPLCNHRFHLGWMKCVVGPALGSTEHWRQAVEQTLPKQKGQKT